MIQRPIAIYNNWSAYDELSDTVELTEELAMREFSEVLRLREAGARFDYYMMDAFWYAPDGAYRAWRTPHWPDGPDRWLDACSKHDVGPGLWLAGNCLLKLDPAPQWRDSAAPDGKGMCMFHGGFLPDFLDVMRLWYGRGVRAFKIDFLRLDAAPEEIRHTLLPSEIRSRNVAALRDGLAALRRDCPDVVLIGYNGFEERPTQSSTALPFRKTVDPAWLEVFDSLYSGDPRPSDVPTMSFWRSKDIYSDHMVRVFERNGFLIPRIDNAGFMMGTTGTCYRRAKSAWKGMLILSLARGGWVNTYHGNLELLDDEEAAWFGRVQSMFLELQVLKRITTFGGIPGESRPYGFRAESDEGTVLTVVNPAQAEETVELPGRPGGRILFRDAGYRPALGEGRITLGPEQMAVIGTGRYDSADFDLGVQEDVVIPESIAPLPAEFVSAGEKEIEATVDCPGSGRLRVVMRQRGPDGIARRMGRAPLPDRKPMGELLAITAEQEGKPVHVTTDYDRIVWSGLSWAVGEIDCGSLVQGTPVTVRCSTVEPAEVKLAAEIHHVQLASGPPG
jgi:hypothetical protein